MKKIQKYILSKLFNLYGKINEKFNFTSNNGIPKNFKKFDLELQNLTGTHLEAYFALRAKEIHHIIKKYEVKSILEMGTGRSSFIFNSYKEINVLSIEQDIDWLQKIKKAFKKFDIENNIILSDVELYKNGAKYTNIPNFVPDLLYIDAPYVKYESKNFNTFTKKPAYYDFETLFNKQIFPKIIMIEGRTDTVDAIFSSAFADRYDFYGEYIYHFEREQLISALAFRRHSTFILKK